MTESLQKTPRQVSIEKGEQLVVALAAYFILLEVFTLIVKVINGQTITITNMIRLTLTLVLCIYLYKGKSWAKLLLTLAAGLGVLVGIWAVWLAAGNLAFPTFPLVVLISITILNAVAVYYLIFSSDIDEFVKSRSV